MNIGVLSKTLFDEKYNDDVIIEWYGLKGCNVSVCIKEGISVERDSPGIEFLVGLCTY